MISKWTQHLSNPEEQKAFENEIRGSKRVLDRLIAIIEEKETSMNIQEMSLSSYDTPNWSHKQAHNNGFRQCLSSYKTLINLDPRLDGTVKSQKDNTNDPRQPIPTTA